LELVEADGMEMKTQAVAQIGIGSTRPNPVAMAECFDLQGRHSKYCVRVSCVGCRPAAAGSQLFVERSAVSDCFPSYTSDDNSAIVATKSIKNTVHYLPFSLSLRHSPSVVCLLMGFLCSFGCM
jgi:hypothetical protein